MTHVYIGRSGEEFALLNQLFFAKSLHEAGDIAVSEDVAQAIHSLPPSYSVMVRLCASVLLLFKR